MPTSTESFSSDEQVTIALGEGFSGAAANDGNVYFYNAPKSSAGAVTLTNGVATTTEVWRKWYPNNARTKTPSYKLVFRRGDVPTTATIALASATPPVAATS
jgi:hypothetical protein